RRRIHRDGTPRADPVREIHDRLELDPLMRVAALGVRPRVERRRRGPVLPLAPARHDSPFGLRRGPGLVATEVDPAALVWDHPRREIVVTPKWSARPIEPAEAHHAADGRHHADPRHAVA